MKIAKAIAVSCTLILATAAAAQAQEKDRKVYLYDAVETNPALKASFNEVIAPVVEESPWLSKYGTAAPAESVRIDDTEYVLFWGCKPHECVNESYAVLYNPEQKAIVAGALLKNTFDETGDYLKSAEITWLGDAQWDQASLISKHLY